MYNQPYQRYWKKDFLCGRLPSLPCVSPPNQRSVLDEIDDSPVEDQISDDDELLEQMEQSEPEEINPSEKTVQ